MPGPLDVLKTIFIPKSGEAAGLFQASATIITLSTIYLYFAGYVYCYFYYSMSFQVPLEILGASPQFYWIRAFTALDNPYGGALVSVVILTVIGYLGKKIPTWAIVLVMIGAFPALYQICRYEGEIGALWTKCRPPNVARIHFKVENAKSPDAEAKSTQPGVNPRNSAHPLALESNPKAPAGSAAQAKIPDLRELVGLAPDISDPRELVALGENNELFLLLETKDRLVLVRAPVCDRSDPPNMTKAPHVYTLPRDAVDLVNLSVP